MSETFGTPAKTRLYGLVEFGPSVFCAKEVLASTTPVVIDGVEGHLELPCLPDWSDRSGDYLSMPLVGPSDARGWKRGAPLYWGVPVSYPSGESTVSLALLTFDVDTPDLAGQSTKVHRGFTRWMTMFVDCLELLTKQRHPPRVHAAGDVKGLDLFCWSADGTAERPQDHQISHITITQYGDDTALYLPQLKAICELASKGDRLSLVYEMQLDAYRAMRAGDYRKAIAQTAVAAELAFTGAIKSRFEATGVAYGSSILDKFRTLGQRLELASAMGLDLPMSKSDIKNKLVEPRNNVMHEARDAGKQNAFQAVKVTDEILACLGSPFATNDE